MFLVCFRRACNNSCHVEKDSKEVLGWRDGPVGKVMAENLSSDPSTHVKKPRVPMMPGLWDGDR